MEERFSGPEDMIEEMDISVRENVKFEKLMTEKNPRNLEYCEKTTPKNNRTRRRKRTPAQRTRKYFQPIIKKIFLI